MTLAAGRPRISLAPRRGFAPPPKDAENWRLDARCRGLDTEIFYRPDGVTRSTRVARERAAKEICAACPVQEQCLDWAIRTGEPAGIWGGMTPEERGVARRIAG
jgi:WhiB family redox-sensing transcriptional regulator